jgi:hypothetical protein
VQPIAFAAEALMHLTEQEGGPICILRSAITAIRQRPEDVRTVIYFSSNAVAVREDFAFVLTYFTTGIAPLTRPAAHAKR